MPFCPLQDSGHGPAPSLQRRIRKRQPHHGSARAPQLLKGNCLPTLSSLLGNFLLAWSCLSHYSMRVAYQKGAKGTSWEDLDV